MKVSKIVEGFQKCRQAFKIGCDLNHNSLSVAEKSIDIVMSEENAITVAETVKQLRKASDRFLRRAAKLQAELNSI